MHVHVYTPNGEAKYWKSPNVELAINSGLKPAELKTAQIQIILHEDEIKAAWKKHFG